MPTGWTEKSAAPTLESRHQPSGLHGPFTGDQLPFAGYVSRTLEMLLQAHATKASSERETIAAGNAPFQAWPTEDFPKGRARPYRRGVLLIHGLTDSPYSMRHLAALFRQQGFRVMAILLPGHGTQPGDLLEARWQEWVRATAYGAERLAEEVDDLYLAGYSAGGTLAIRHALLDARVRGLFLFSPALKISPRAAWAGLHRMYSWLIPAAKWVDIKPDRDIYKYESFPKNAAYQMHGLTRDLRVRLQGREVNIPVFAAASADDATVDSGATLAFMARARHEQSRLVYYTADTAHHLAGIHKDKVELVPSAVPEQNIISFSHLSIVLPSADVHYGAAGDYANCLHYYPHDMEKYALCGSRSPLVLQGEVTERCLRAGVIRRLTYNPHYAALATSMQRFIERLA